MGTRFPFRVLKRFWNYIVVIVAQYCECTKHHWIVHFKTVEMVNFMICELCHTHPQKMLVELGVELRPPLHRQPVVRSGLHSEYNTTRSWNTPLWNLKSQKRSPGLTHGNWVFTFDVITWSTEWEVSHRGLLKTTIKGVRVTPVGNVIWTLVLPCWSGVLKLGSKV